MLAQSGQNLSRSEIDLMSVNDALRPLVLPLENGRFRLRLCENQLPRHKSYKQLYWMPPELLSRDVSGAILAMTACYIILAFPYNG